MTTNNDNLEKYTQLKRKVEQAQHDADRAEGALEQVMRELRKNFDCSTLEEAQEKLKILKKREVEVGDAFTLALDEFEKKWKDKI